ncbi:hypothetical protein P3T39_003460 [Kitasatospora sp. GP82]|nr:hypothetical protein [Kitasatospora sp. GP82]
MKIDDYQALGSTDDQKLWLDTVGPIEACFDVYTDFDAYSSGVYHHTTGTYRGGHCVAIVGYSDVDNCWIAKNSWGKNWGDSGYVRIGYGEVNIDTNAKYGVLATNPDPWTKRRLHNGNLIEGGNGTNHRNFELVCVLNNGQMQHWWRDNDGGMVWNPGPVFGSGIDTPPVMIQGQYGMSTEDAVGNFELCVAAGGQVQHWWRDNQGDMSWYHSATFGHDVAAVAGLLESSFGFDLEVVVLRNDGQLQHYWRDSTGWNEGVLIGPA